MKLLTKKTLFAVFMVAAFAGFNNSAARAENIKDGIKLIDKEKFDAARAFFGDLVKKEPKNPEAFYYLAEVYANELNYDTAKIYYQKGTEVNAENPINFVGLGKMMLIKNDTVEAKKYFDKAQELTDAKSDNTKIMIAEAYVDADYKSMTYPLQLLEEARQIYKKEAAKNKKARPNAKLYMAYGDVYAKMNDGSKAAENYYNATAYDSTLIQAYVGGAAVYKKIKNYADAQDYLNRAIRIDPTYSVAYREQGELYYAQKQYDKAKEAYANYMKYSENTARNLSRYATILYRSKNYEQAISTLNDALKMDPKNTRLLKFLAMTYGNVDDIDKGLETYKKYFEQEKDQSKIDAGDYSQYGTLSLKKGNEEDAIKYFNKAIALDTNYIKLHSDISMIYMKQKNWNGVISELKLKADATKKNLSIVEYFNLGQSYYFSKKYHQSDSVFAKVTELVPTQIQAYLWRARSLSAIDSTSEKGLAKTQYEKIVELVSAAPDQTKFKNIMIEAYSYLGYQYFLKKDEAEYKAVWRDKYKENWENVLKLDPENQRAKDALDNLKKIK